MYSVECQNLGTVVPSYLTVAKLLANQDQRRPKLGPEYSPNKGIYLVQV